MDVHGTVKQKKDRVLGWGNYFCGQNKSSSLLTEETTLKEGQCLPRRGTLRVSGGFADHHTRSILKLKNTNILYIMNIYYEYILVTKFIN